MEMRAVLMGILGKDTEESIKRLTEAVERLERLLLSYKIEIQLTPKSEGDK